MASASLLILTHALFAQAQQVAQARMTQAAQEVPEQVLITGSLIRGTAAVGVPVTNLSTADFRQTGALTVADLFRTIPTANVYPRCGCDKLGRAAYETKYENRPSPQAGYNGHWTQIVHRFSRLVTVAPDDVVRVLFGHDRTQIGIDLLE